MNKNKSRHRSPPGEKHSLETVHAFSEWQSVYSDTLALNYMLHSPFHATNPAMLYSSEKAIDYASWPFDCLYSECTDDEEKMFKIITSKEATSLVRTYRTPDLASPITCKNRFSALSSMDN